MRQKIKVIHVIPTLDFGGAERLLLDIVRKGDRSKFDYEVMAMVRAGGLEKDFKAAGVPLKIFYKKSKLGLGIFINLYKYFKNKKPDIVHTHLFGADLWAGLAAYFARVPVITKTEHNVNLNEPPIKILIKYWTSFVFKKMIAISPAVRDWMIEEERMPAGKIKIIYNGIELSRFSDKEVNGFSKPPILINVARFEEQKGHRCLIRALRKIKDIDWNLWLVGDGSLKQKIEKMVREAGLGGRVKFWGNRNDVPELLARSDIFVFPSLWEGLGISLLEAGAVGLPIVATGVGGIKDIFTDNKDALLVSEKNEDDLAEAIKWMLEHRDKALFLGREAQLLVREKYSLAKMVSEYESLYEDTLNK